MRSLHKNCSFSYALMQAATWSFYAIVLAFSSNVLYELQFSDSAISLFLGICTALSVAVQVGSAELLNKVWKLGVHVVMVVFGLLMLLCAAVLLLPGGNRTVIVLCFGTVCMLLQTLPSLTNSIGMDTIRRGASTNYSFARGMGSLGYSTTALLTGVLVRQSGVRSVHLLTIAASLLLIFAALWYHNATKELLPADPEQIRERRIPFFKTYPRFGIFLIGMAFLCISHGLLCNFMFQIMLSRNGGAMEQGIATSLSSLVELPIMFGFTWMLKKKRCDKWVKIAGFAMALKPLLILLSGSPYGIYLAQATQSIGYGLWVIASVNYAERVVSAGESIRAQSYHGATTTASTVVAVSLGGILIEYLGVQFMVGGSLACTLIGSVIVLFSTEKTDI